MIFDVTAGSSGAELLQRALLLLLRGKGEGCMLPTPWPDAVTAGLRAAQEAVAIGCGVLREARVTSAIDGATTLLSSSPFVRLEERLWALSAKWDAGWDDNTRWDESGQRGGWPSPTLLQLLLIGATALAVAVCCRRAVCALRGGESAVDHPDYPDESKPLGWQPASSEVV